MRITAVIRVPLGSILPFFLTSPEVLQIWSLIQF